MKLDARDEERQQERQSAVFLHSGDDLAIIAQRRLPQSVKFGEASTRAAVRARAGAAIRRQGALGGLRANMR
jgi:hypothetical protein